MTFWQQLTKLIWDHRAKAMAVTYFVFVTLVHTMPMSVSVHHPWLYAFLHDLAGGLGGNK